MKLTPLKQTHRCSAFLILTLLTIGISKSSYAQPTLDWYAGIGTYGYSGDGGLATSAEMTYPIGMAIDRASNLYFVDRNSLIIRRIDGATGIITTVAGVPGSGGYNGDGIPATTATMVPSAIALDNAGNLYICDAYRIRKVNTSGIISTIAGNGSPGISGDLGPATAASVDYTQGITVDASGNVYIAGSNRIREIYAATAKINTIAGTGVGGYSGDGGPATAAKLYGPGNIKVDAIGTLYISDVDNNSIRKVTSSGIISTVAGNGTFGYSGDGGPATSAQLALPVDVTFDGNGNLYIADADNDVIRKVTSGGTISTIAGNGSIVINPVCNNPTSISIGEPNSIAFDNYGCYYIGDGFNNRILKYSAGITIFDVDLNSYCVPGASSPPVTPTFTVTPSGGIPPYTYNWVANSGNVATLSSYTVASPQVIGYTLPGCADFTLTVGDNSTCFTGWTTHVKACLINSGTWDLAMRDSHNDMFDEPNSQNAVTGNWNIWQSQDVWNRINADGFTTHQDPCYGCTNHMYTTIRNVGCVPSPTFGTLKLYWTIGGLAETWPGDWTTNLFGTTTLPQGLQIATIPISTSIPPGGTMQYSTSWTPPNPGSYYPGATSMELCFLARIEDMHNTSNLPTGMTYPEGSGISANVLNNNNIVTRNTEVIFVNNYSPRSVFLMVGNAGTTAQTYSLQFVNEHALSGGTSTLNQFLTVTVYLGSVFNSWVQGGAQGTYSTVNYQNQSVTFDGTNTVQLDNISFLAGEEDLIQADFTMNNNVNGTQMQDETVHFRELCANNCTAQIYGNFSFFVTFGGGQQSTNGGGGGPQNRSVTTSTNLVKTPLNNIKVFPNPATTTLNFEFPLAQLVSVKLMDITGRVVTEQSLENATSTNLNVENFTPGLYMYQITTDGKIQSGKIIVEK